MHNLNKFVKEDIIMRVGGEKLYYGTYQKLMENPEYKKAQEEILKRTLSEIDNMGKTQPNASAQTWAPEGGFLSILKTDTMDKNTLDAVKTVHKSDKKLLLLEYSEFHCPHCQKQAHDGVVPRLSEKYKDNLEEVFVPFTRDTDLAKRYLCLKDENPEKDRDIILKAFNGELSSDKDVEKVALELWLKKDKFAKCFAEKATEDKVVSGVKEGAGLFQVQGTPTTAIINTETGKYYLIEGAMPYEAFEEATTELLK